VLQSSVEAVFNPRLRELEWRGLRFYSTMLSSIARDVKSPMEARRMVSSPTCSRNWVLQSSCNPGHSRQPSQRLEAHLVL